MPILFNPSRSVHNLMALAQVQKLDLSGLDPELAMSASHMVMAYAYALGALGYRIGHGEGEIAPEDAMRALIEGLRETAPMARKDLAEQAATTLPDGAQPG